MEAQKGYEWRVNSAIITETGLCFDGLESESRKGENVFRHQDIKMFLYIFHAKHMRTH